MFCTIVHLFFHPQSVIFSPHFSVEQFASDEAGFFFES